MRTPKETIIYCLERLIAQGGCSYRVERGHNYCMYRSIVDGQERCCAVGVFIKNEDYTPAIEGQALEDLDLEFPDDNIEVLKQLQYFHDDVAIINNSLEKFIVALDKIRCYDGEIPINGIRSFLWCYL